MKESAGATPSDHLNICNTLFIQTDNNLWSQSSKSAVNLVLPLEENTPSWISENSCSD